jgi:DNA invertase Pin-like site-specific DNA recombinase
MFAAVDLPEANDLTVGIMALVAQAEREAISRRTKEARAVARSRGVKLGNPNGAAVLRRAGKGGAPLRAAIARNADRHAQDLRLWSRTSGPAVRPAFKRLPKS